MSKSELVVLGQDDAAVCCSPMVREPLGEEAAVDLARMFKALSDPVRPRLLSLIASYERGEACVCDLTGPFDVSQPTISHRLDRDRHLRRDPEGPDRRDRAPDPRRDRAPRPRSARRPGSRSPGMTASSGSAGGRLSSRSAPSSRSSSP
nr:metalloregulator ArsR/SmtB family transcription factor [Streptomyces sp. TLI_235]